MANNIGSFQERTIYDFRSRLTGGGARSNLFECEITFPDTDVILGTDKTEIQLDTRFLIKAAQLPGSSTTTIPVPFRGRTLKIAGDRTFDPWTITILNDTNFRLRNVFERWSNYINRHDDNSGVITPASYQTDMIIHQLSRGNPSPNSPSSTPPAVLPADAAIPILKSYKLYGCHPSTIDPISLSYDTTDSIEEFNVTLEVQWWEAFDSGRNSIFTNARDREAATAVNNVALGNINR